MSTLIQRLHPRRVSQRLLRRAIDAALQNEGVTPRAVEVSVALVDDAAMQALNAQYRGIDQPTDVLSFSQEGEISIPRAPKLLGDIVIAVDTAERQALSAGRSLDEEAAQLAIHGVLHLLGFDDVTPEGYEEMVRKGAEIWQRVQSAQTAAR